MPWAAPHGRFTLWFECFAIEVLLACQSVSAACAWMGLHWGSAQRIIARCSPVHRPPLFPSASSAVERGLARRSLEGIERVGMDEKSFGRGQDDIGLLNDLDGPRVPLGHELWAEWVEVTPGHDTESGRRLWQALEKAQRGKVKAAAMEMSPSTSSGHSAGSVSARP